MQRSDLKGKVREKFLFVGRISTGKTYLILIIAKLYAMNGKKVLIIDPEDGTQREIEAGIFNDLTEEQLALIQIEHTNTIEDCLKWVNGWEEDSLVGKVTRGNDYDLKIFDGLSAEMELYKYDMVQDFIKQKKYYIGEKEYKITNPDLFTLPYQHYNKLYDQLKDVILTLMKHKFDIICTTHPFKETTAQQTLEQFIYGKFDTVVELKKTLQLKGIPKWDGVVEKNRGRERPDKENTIESARPLIVYFIKKFGMPVEETIEKLKFKVYEEQEIKIAQT